MHLLPLSLGRLADHAARSDFRFAMSGVLLRVRDDNTFEAVATDARVLARATGPCVADPSAFPSIPALADAPDGLTEALIPPDTWKRAFTWARKLIGGTKPDNPAAHSVAVRVGGERTTFGVSDGEHPWTEAAANISGRFPPYEDILRALPRGGGRDRIVVDPGLLAQVLLTAGEFSPDRESPEVDVETFGQGRPVVVRAGRPGGVEFVGLVMPLARG